jgi:transaldolase
LIPSINDLKVKLFADGADLEGMVKMASLSHISGLTTNPTLMKKAGITDYTKFAREVLGEISLKPISFEVFSDDVEEMKIQGEKIASWGDNVYVKVPITNTRGETTESVVRHLSDKGIKVNVTAVMTHGQLQSILEALNPEVSSYISVFAGRIADTARDPINVMKQCLETIATNVNSELIWASPRELLNVFQANDIGCHVITATNDILKKLDLVGKNLEEYSIETVQMFFQDAKSSGYTI